MEQLSMPTIVTGIVTNGQVIPASPLPEGAQVDVYLKAAPSDALVARPCLTASELLKLPRAERDIYLAAAAELAEQDYREDRELTGFEAFSEELDDDDSAEG
jgi:hypothetical protein